MNANQHKEFILFRRKDGNYGIVSSRAFFNRQTGNKAKQFLECHLINESDKYEDLQAQIKSAGEATTAKAPVKKVMTAPASFDVETDESDANSIGASPEEIEALNEKMAQDGFKKTMLTKREKEVLKSLQSKEGDNE